MSSLVTIMCKYCGSHDHTIVSCEHLTVHHEADACDVCAKKRRVKLFSSSSKSSASLYASQSYWQNRYENTTHEAAGSGRNEWFVSFDALRDVLVPLAPVVNALDIGCGMSLLSEELLVHKIASKVTAIDFSDVAIEHMRKRSSSVGLEYIWMDATGLKFKDHSFDFVIEKGTLDALLTDESENSDMNSKGTKLLSEVKRVLSDEGGTFVSVSHTETREKELNKCGFQVNLCKEVKNVARSYYVYVCRLDEKNDN